MKILYPVFANLYRVRSYGVIGAILASIARISFGQGDVINYDPHWWHEITLPTACEAHGSWPDSGIFYTMFFAEDLPLFGYPLHTALKVGLNDTAQIVVQWYNRTDKPYDLKSRDYEHWFVPQVYQMWVTDSIGPVFRSPKELGYRIRGWYDGLRLMAAPDRLPSPLLRNGGWAFKIDVWNLPEGRFQLCLLPTDSLPKEIGASMGGYVYNLESAQSLVDSVNALEACFWRVEEDTNYKACQYFVDKIMAINPYSVPGWWLQAYLSWDLHDTAGTKKAYDNALAFLKERLDPALPDSSKRAISEHEQNYLEFLQVTLARNRSLLGP